MNVLYLNTKILDIVVKYCKKMPYSCIYCPVSCKTCDSNI